MCQLIAVIFGFILHGQASLILSSSNKNATIELEDAEASFGPEITDELPWGNISDSDPRLACDDIQPPPLKGVFFALADRGLCDFVVKVLSIQKANYLGAIIVNTESDYVFPMGSNRNINISIPAIMIGNTSGLRIRQHYLYDKHFLAKMTPNPGTSIEYYLVPLLITLSLAFLGIIIFLGIRVLRNCLRQSKNRLSRDILNKLPEIRFSEDYQSLYDTCAICLEDYVIGDKLRVLPCHHAYHSKCVDRWLLRRQRSCPVCKYRIHRAHDEQDSDTDDPHQTTGEGPDGSGAATVEESSRSRAGIQEHPELDASLAYENTDTANDIAPLLSKSAPVASWLSGGQLPQHGSTWLGYDNPAVEDDDEELIDQPSRPSPMIEKCNESEPQETHPDEVPDVSILDPSSSIHPPSQLSRAQAPFSGSVEEKMEVRKTEEEEVDQQTKPLVEV